MLVVGVAGLAALLVRGALRGRGLHVPAFGMGQSELVLILLIVIGALVVARRR
jgi:hypothetical protein